MRTFTDDELESLIRCPKEVAEPPRREMRLDGKMKRNDMTFKSTDGKHSFRAFLRQSEEFPETSRSDSCIGWERSREVFNSSVATVSMVASVSIRMTPSRSQTRLFPEGDL